MLTKNKIQSIRNLHDKTGRRETGYFLVEGRKGIAEFIDSDFEIVEGFFVPDFEIPEGITFPCTLISEKELERMSTLSSNRDGLLVVKMRVPLPTSPTRGGAEQSKNPTLQHSQNLTLILDGINDPGNLGTIIRIADWYGISRIVCSLDTVDCYNPKVLMATMGSFTRVHLEYRDLSEYLGLINNGEGTINNYPIYGAYLEGESIRTKEFTLAGGYLVIGSESHGIRSNLEQYITDKVTIPRIGQAESLNAGVATGIILERIMGI